MTFVAAEEIVKTSLDRSVLTIRLFNPQRRNAISIELREQLGRAVERADRDPAVRVVVLAGEGPTFCSGGDLNMLLEQSDPWSVHHRFRAFSRWLVPLIRLEKPVVVALRGPAVGGGVGLALTGDVIIAGEEAQLVPGFFRVGVIPDVAVMYHLPRLIGMARAKQFLFGGVPMSAREALGLGLVTSVVPDDEVEHAAMSEARRLAEGPVEVMGLAKRMMARSFESGLDEMLAFEGFGQALAMSGASFQEGVNAMLQRRPADFQSAQAAAAGGSKASQP